MGYKGRGRRGRSLTHLHHLTWSHLDLTLTIHPPTSKSSFTPNNTTSTTMHLLLALLALIPLTLAAPAPAAPIQSQECTCVNASGTTRASGTCQIVGGALSGGSEEWVAFSFPSPHLSSTYYPLSHDHLLPSPFTYLFTIPLHIPIYHLPSHTYLPFPTVAFLTSPSYPSPSPDLYSSLSPPSHHSAIYTSP